MKKSAKHLALFITIATLAITGCKKDKAPEPEKEKPKAENIEIGTGNNKRGIIGRDFHFNADILAGDKIENVQVKILQKTGGSYSAVWKFEVTWEEFKGAKNTTVHKHFTIPTDAPKGNYDFYFIVKDQNGSTLEIKEDFTILSVEDLPIDPKIELREAPTPNQVFKKGENINVRIRINDTKDLGITNILLIKDKAKHYPEHAVAIDYNKSIVMLMRTEPTAITAGNALFEIGRELDNHQPNANPITGDKTWESGKYNIVIIYQNTTHNISTFYTIPIVIDYQ